MRNSFAYVLIGWERDTAEGLKSRLKKLEAFTPLEDDEVEVASAVFNLWMLKLDALEKAERNDMKKSSPEKEARREQKREDKMDKQLVLALQMYGIIMVALLTGVAIGWMAHTTDLMWLFQW